MHYKTKITTRQRRMKQTVKKTSLQETSQCSSLITSIKDQPLRKKKSQQSKTHYKEDIVKQTENKD
jgi:hypothetical protein